MCGRFALNETPKKLSKYFQLTDDLEFLPSWNIAHRLASVPLLLMRKGTDISTRFAGA
ncbi:MAG: hypothetical protein Q8L02_05720 [Candidatus Nitrotoga sp.]|nr:hypothetical protein [Candidatus Nitrotoga sp.]